MGFTASSKRGRCFKTLRIPLHLIFLVRDITCLSAISHHDNAGIRIVAHALVGGAPHLRRIFGAISGASGGSRCVGYTRITSRHPSPTHADAAFVNAHLDQQPHARAEASLEHLSDLEVAKASKAAADRAARDEAVRNSVVHTQRTSHLQTAEIRSGVL